MKAIRLGFLLQLAALLAVVALPAAAPASVVPPENSGANQYTETFPTGGGNKDAYAEGDEISPGKAIGKRNVDKLKDRGAEGAEVAEVAAETSPTTETVVVVEEEEPSEGAGGGGGNGSAGGGNGSSGGNGATGGGAADPTGGQPQANTADKLVVQGDPGVEGASGTGEIVGQVLGTSGTGMGALLPLLMLGAIAWAFVFAARQRRDSTS